MRQNQPPPSTTANHQKYALLTVIILCVLPFLLNQLGISFAAYSATSSPEPSSIDHLVHVLLEWSAISIAVIAALASVLHYRCHKNINVPVIGMALASAGLLDAFHLLATTGIIIANTPEHQFIPFTWALTRIFAALAMTLAGAAMLWTAHQAKLQQTESHQSKIHHSRLLIRFSLIFLALTSGAIHLTLGNGALPQTIYPQAFLTRPFDVLPFALFLFSGTLFWLWYQQLKSPLRLALLLSLIPQMVAQLHMVFGHENGLDNSSNIAHGLKILAYGCILIGILLELMKKTDQTTTANTLAPAHLTMLSEQDNQDFLETGKATQPLAIQLPVAAFILAISVTFIVSFTFYLESAQLIKKQEVSQLRIEGELVEPLLAQLYRQSSSDLFFLANIPPIQGLITADNLNDSVNYQLWHGRLEKIFSEMLKTKPGYSQISYIGIADNGFELVTVMNNAGGVVVIPSSKRQNNGYSAYFQHTIKLNPGEIYFSAVELNRKNNQIVIPHQPIIQVATPIYDPLSGDIYGIVSISVDFGFFIKELTEIDLPNLNLFLANQAGDYLYHPDPRLSFGFDLGQRHLLQQTFPALTQAVESGIKAKEFSALTDDQNRQNAAYFQRIELAKYGSSQPLLLLLQPRHNTADLELSSFRNRSILIGISLSFAALALAVLASRRVAQPLVRLTSTVQDYEKSGQLPTLPTHSNDETGVLARSFYNLLLRINMSREAQQQASEQAQESSNRLQSIVNSAADAIITIDTKGHIQSFNTAAETLFGYHENEVIDHNVSMLMPPHFGQKHDQYIENYLTSNISKIIGIERELVGLTKDQQTFAIRLAISEVSTTQGTIFTGIIRDISVQKREEQEKEKNLSLLEAILESSDNGILVTNPSGQTLRVNSRFKQIWSITAPTIDDSNEKELLEHNLQQLTNPQDVSQNRQALLDDPTMESFDILHLKDGRVLERTSRPMLVNGVSTGRIWSFHDVTLAKQTEKALIDAKETAETIVLYKSEFIASMSHEIRTPMNGVLGMINLLRQSQLDNEQQRHCQLAQSSAESLLVIINDILDFSKFESGKLKLEIIDFNLRSQLGEFAESVSHRAQEKGLELVLDVVGITQTMVKGDPGRLRQVLTNLVGNAIKFTPDGEIIVRATLKPDNSNTLRLHCAISDTGIGIEQSKLSGLFDSFTQVDASTTREYGGTGLGLAIVKQLCDLMGGSVRVSSEAGKGSCFEFDILLQNSHVSEVVMPKVDIHGIHILVVDDNTTNRAVLRDQFEQWGAIVFEAENGEAALIMMHKHLSDPTHPHFDVAFVDMQMPGMDGMALSQAIRDVGLYGDTKLVMMTSMSSRGDAKLFADAGFCAYFPKPATTSDLFDSLAVVIAGGEVLSQAQPLVTHHYLKGLKAAGDAQPVEIAQPPKPAFAADTRILLVEDNFINQAVAVSLLESHGLSCDLANNGIEALKTLNSAELPYQLILMDCQMPEMDGYETTQQIR